jgi:hypothetical protein
MTWKRWLGVLGGLGIGAAAVASATGATTAPGAYEEPPATVEATHDGFEVRRYAPSIEARVTVAATSSAATRRAPPSP